MYQLTWTLGAAGIVLCVWAAGVRAQFDGPDVRRPARSSYDVVALRVEFQPDTSRFTTGSGTFDGTIFDTLDVSIDPLPHDSDYFNAHLRFLKHYVRRVSDRQTVLRTHLIPDIVRLPHQMGYYSPTGPRADEDAEQQKLVRLVRDAWEQADRQSAFDMSRFDPQRTALVLFHAGAGRDIELVGTSLNNTPEDIPSVYLGSDRLSASGGTWPTFDGFPITHSIILPQTESRLGVDPLTEQPFVAEFSTNGMLAAAFFNYLGVPDLFDTDTGEPGIGPFGLMDPLGIFSYNGLFPPEPTAWTKYYLGWIDPPEIPLREMSEVSLTAVADTSSSDAVLVRISEAEYFLVENRQRDPRRDGLHLEVWRDGAFTTQQIAAGQEDFSRFDPAGFAGGVVTGVDAYDWAIPGGLTEEGDIMYGGIAIWHIDERRLAEGMPTNTVNTDPRRRAVDLEEADGAQDIGFATESVLGPGGEQGTPFDLYFQGNPVRVVTDRGETSRLYTNRFGPDTRPSSANAEGGPGFIELSEFSGPDRQMTLRAGPAPTAAVQSILGLRGYGVPGRFGKQAAVAALSSEGDTTAYFVPAGGMQDSISITALRPQGTVEHRAWTVSTGLKPARFGSQMITIRPGDAGDEWTLQIGDSTRMAVDASGQRPVGPPVVVQEEGSPVLYAGFRGEGRSRLIRWTGGDDLEHVTESIPERIIGLAGAGGGRLAVVGENRTIVRGGGERWSYELSDPEAVDGLAFGRDREGLMGVLADTSGRELVILNPDETVHRIESDLLGLTGPLIPVLSDLDGDGALDILVTAHDRLAAFSRAGALIEGFPVGLPAPAVTQPLVLQFAGRDRWSVIVGSTTGYLYSYDVRSAGRPDVRFPLAVGRSLRTTPLIENGVLLAASESGSVQAWHVSGVDTVAWGQLHADAQNRSYVQAAGFTQEPPQASGPGILSPERTYNWPNPVRGGETNIRIVLEQPCDVRITIVDMAGTLVEEISIDGVPARVPFETAWQADVPSGVYYARVRATAADGRTDTELITIAVIR